MEQQMTKYTSKKAKAVTAGLKSEFGQTGFENELLKWIFLGTRERFCSNKSFHIDSSMFNLQKFPTKDVSNTILSD